MTAATKANLDKLVELMRASPGKRFLVTADSHGEHEELLRYRGVIVDSKLVPYDDWGTVRYQRRVEAYYEGERHA